MFIHSGVTIGDLASVVTMPVWLGALRRYGLARSFAVLGLLTACWGILLSDMAATDHRIDSTQRLGSTVLLLGITAGIGVVLWARTVLSIATIGLCYGGGQLVDNVLIRSGGSNAWKNHWAVPVAMVALSLVMIGGGQATRRWPAAVATLLALAAISAFSDSRSYAATFLIGALLLLWQVRPRTISRSSSTWLAVAMMGAVSAATYWLASKLLVAGYLGAQAQERSIAQIDQSGSLILGGRPELEATLSLMHDRPTGFGVGVVPGGHDILVAKGGLSSINYNPNNGYVEKYMLGGHIELHSLFGDLWAGWGFAGLLLLALIALVLLRGIAVTVAHNVLNPLGVFLFVWDIWNLFFSPIYSSTPTLVIGVGLAFALRPPYRSGPGEPTT